MTHQYRLKTYKDEEGEYSDYQSADKNRIIEIIETHWTNDTMPNGLEIISISNEHGQHLLLEHFQKYVFDVYYLPLTTDSHFHKKSTIEIVFKAIDLFFDNHLADLESCLNKTKKENKYIRGDFFYIDHNYRYKAERSVKEGLWMIYGIPIGVMTICIGVGAFITPLALINIFGVFLLLLGFYFWIPGLLLHLQYKNDIGDWSIKITRGQDKIVANSSVKSKSFDKKDIVKILKYENPAYRNPWSEYGYLQIEFKSGEIINITNLLCDQLFILDKFATNNLETRTVKSWIPKIKRRTKIE